MAEDKRIRVSADITPLRQLREEAISLYREIDQASSSSQLTTERNLQQLREQLSLMENRNELEKLLIDLKKQAALIETPVQPTRQQQPIYDRDTNSVYWDLSQQPEEIPSPEEEKPKQKRKKKKKVKEQLDFDGEPEYDEETGSVKWTARKKGDVGVEQQKGQEELLESVKNIEKNTVGINENTTLLKDRNPVEVKFESTNEKQNQRQESTSRPEREESQSERYDNNQQREVFSDENILKAISSLELTFDKDIRGLSDVLKNIGKDKDTTPNTFQSSVTRYLETFVNSISLIEDNVERITLAVEGQRGGGNGDRGNGGVNIPISSRGGSQGGGLASLAKGAGWIGLALEARNLLNNAKNVLIEREFRNQEALLRSEYQGTIETGANFTRVQAANEADKYRWIPFIGDIIARKIEMPANIEADRLMTTAQKYMSAESRVIPYAQTFGTSTQEAMRTAFNEGSYAANALGMDVSQYLQRRTELTRAAGGRGVGGTEFDPTARREAQSLMAVERLYGIDSGTINRLQGSLRFGDQNTLYGGSAIIREIERGMKELNIPFSEIAATIGESLETFNKRADEILSKAGDFDAAKIVAVMNGVRIATGLEGRQLERVQTAFSGSGLSQDEVTQALLLRTLTSTDPNVKTYSEAMEKLEKVRSGDAEPEFMRDFLLQLQGLTQNNEQFMNILKGVFPNLSWQDIRSQFASGDQSEIINSIFNKIQESFQAIKDRPREAYAPDEARRTVGVGEKITASDFNRQAGEGGESIATILKAIRENTDKIRDAMPSSVVEETEKFFRENNVSTGVPEMTVTQIGMALGQKLAEVFLRKLYSTPTQPKPDER